MKKKDISMKKRALTLALLLVFATAPACTNKQGETEAPVFITVSLELQQRGSRKKRPDHHAGIVAGRGSRP